MSGGLRFNVNPGQLRGSAGRARARATDFVSGQRPEVGAGNWPTQHATRRFHASVAGANHGFSTRMNDTADGTTNAANVYEQQDQAAGAPNVAAISAKDASGILTGVIKDVATAVSGVVGPLMSGLAGGVGALGSAAASGVGALANSAAQVAGQAAVTQSKTSPPPTVVGAGLSGDVAAHGKQVPARTVGPVSQPGPAGLSDAQADPTPRDHMKAGLPPDHQDRAVPAARTTGVSNFAEASEEHHPFAVKVRTVHTPASKLDYDGQPTAEIPATVLVSVAPKWSKH